MLQEKNELSNNLVLYGAIEPMKIIIDGVIYSFQKAGGISRLFNEVLPRVCSYDIGISFQILLNNRNIQPLPAHENISCLSTYKIESYLRPWRLWKHKIIHVKDYFNSLYIGNSKDLIWHSTYYTIPKKWNGAVVVTVYDLIYELYKESYFRNDYDDQVRRSIRTSVTQSDKVVAISNTTRQDLENNFGVPQDKIKVIHLACNDLFKQVPTQDTSNPFLLFVGGRNLYKNFGGLLKAYSCWPRNNEVGLVVVGPNWSADEIKSITQLKLLGKVRLIQNADDIVLRDLYNQAFAFAYTSMYEGFGIPLLEAMACGCPIIASRIPSTVEIAADIPIYHEPGNVDGILSNLEQVYSESRPSERISRGLEHVKTYSWEKTAQQMAHLYRELNS